MNILIQLDQLPSPYLPKVVLGLGYGLGWRGEQKARAKTRGARARRRTGHESRSRLASYPGPLARPEKRPSSPGAQEGLGTRLGLDEIFFFSFCINSKQLQVAENHVLYTV